MKKAVLLLAIMVSVTLLATAQEGGKIKFTVSGEKVTFTRTLTPVPAGTMVVKKPPVAGNTAKKRSAPPEHSARDSRGTNSSETPAWKRAQEENARRLSSLEYGQSNIQLDINDLKRAQVKTEIRLDNIEKNINIIGSTLSNAQALQKNAQGQYDNRYSSQTSEQYDLSRTERREKRFRNGVLIFLGGAALATAIHFVAKGVKNSNQPYQPPTPAPNPAPNPNSGTGGPVTVPVIP